MNHRRRAWVGLAFLALGGMCAAGALAAESKPLKLLVHTPEGNVQGASEGLEIVVGFNQPMVPLEALPEGNGSGPLKIEPPLEGKYRWRGTESLVFTPTEALSLASQYTVTVPASTRSLSGAVLGSEVSWTFETLRPNLQYSEPYTGSAFVELDQNPVLHFNQPMDPERAQGIRIRNAGAPLAGDIRFSLESEPEALPALRALRAFLKADKKNRKPLETVPGSEALSKLTLKLNQKLPLESTLEVVVPKEVLAAAGNLGTAEERVFTFTTYNRFRLTDRGVEVPGDPDEGIDLFFSNPVEKEELAKHCQFTPAVSWENAEAYSSTEDPKTARVHVLLALQPETAYTLKISKNLKDRFKQVLGKDAVLTFKTGSYRPSWYMPTGQGILEAYLEPRIPVTAMNWDTVRTRLALVPHDQVVDVTRGKQPSRFQINAPWRYRITPNVVRRLPLNFKPLLGSSRYGMILADVTDLPPDTRYGDEDENDSENQRHAHARGFFQITDLGISGKFSPDNSLIWVTQLKDALPVAQADIEVRDTRNRVVFTGKTGANGVCELPGWAQMGLKFGNRYETGGRESGDEEGGEGYDWTYGSRPRLWVFAKRGADQALLAGHWGMGISPYEFGISFTDNPKPLQYQGEVFSERGLYRAGEKVYLKGVYREKRRGEWFIPAMKPVTLLVKNARDEEIVNAKLALSPWGSLEYAFKLPANAPTGYYAVETQQENVNTVYGHFRVEAYKPAKFEVKAFAGQSEYLAGQKFTGKVQGKYLFGAPMNKDKTTWAIRLAPYAYTPPKHEGFSFNAEAWWDSQQDYGKLLASGEGELDSQGELALKAALNLQDMRSSAALTLEGTVRSADNQSLSGACQAIVHRGEYYLGIKQNKSFLLGGDALSLDLVACTPQGVNLAGRPLNVKIIKREWNSVRKAGSNGRYEWISEVVNTTVDEARLASQTDPVTHAFKPKGPGFYIVELSSRDNAGNPLFSSGYFYAAGPGSVGWERRNDDRIDLVSDKPAYKPGEVANIMIKNPYDKATALITVDREYIISRRVQEVTGSAPVIQIPMQANYLPNVYVSVTLLKGRLAKQEYADNGDDLSKPSFKMGYINLGVDASSKRLAVQLNTDRAEYRPRETVTVDIQVKNAEGQGTASEVTLAVVDKGVLNLIDYTLPDLFDTFYGSRPLSVVGAESRAHVIGQRNYGEKGENRGGGGGLPGSFRNDFQTTPFFNGHIYTDAQGRGKITFTLPDNLTTFKVMASVHTVTRFGYGDALFKVNKPIMLLESLPRFLRLGDMFTAGVTVHNLTRTAQDVTLSATASGVSLTGVSELVLNVPLNQARAAGFHYTAESLSGAEFKFLASAPGGRDGLQIKLPVLMPKLTETVATYSQTDGSKEEGLKLPEAIFPEIGQLEVTSSSTALSGLEGNLDYLIGYPYGCCEQKLSKLLPMVLAEKIIADFKLAALKGKDLRGIVRQGLAELPEFQRADGGFGYWKDSSLSSPYLTAYVLYVLSKAKLEKYPVDQALVQKAVVYLRAAQTEGDWNWPYSRSIRNTTLAYMQYALSLWEGGDVSVMHRLYDERDHMSAYGLAMLMRGLSLAEPLKAADPAKPKAASWLAKAKQLLTPKTAAAAQATAHAPLTMQQELERMLMNKLKMAPTTAHFEEDEDASGAWIHQSAERTTAVILSTLLEVKGQADFSEKVIHWFMEKRRNGHWQTTQNNAAVFEALQDYYRRYEHDQPDFTARIQLENRKLVEELFQGRSLGVRRAVVPISEIPRGEVLPVTVSKAGTGRLYYGLRLTYAPLQPVKERSEGLEVTKRILTLKGDEARTYQVGETYRVVLKVKTLQERNWVVVDDPLPAGFEAINASFATQSQEALLQAEATNPEKDASRRWWGSFNHVETYDDKVLIFADDLVQGEHTHTYLVKATTAGTFYLPNTKAEEMYAPEVFGWCADQKVQIEPAAGVGK